MLRKIRTVLALVFFIAITLLLCGLPWAAKWLGWTAKVQLLPAILSLNAVAIVFVVLLTLITGRTYCSVICPLGVLQDGISRLHKKTFRFRKELPWLRYGILVLFVAAFVAGLQPFVALLAPYSAYGRMVGAALALSGETIVVWSTVLIALAWFLLVALLSWTGGRTYCNSICPVGTTLGLLSRFSLLRPVIDPDRCRNCRKCEHSCKSSCIDIANHKIDYSRCVACFNCIGECKFDAIHYEPAIKARKTAVDGGRRAFLAGSALVIGSAVAKAQGKKVDGGFAAIADKTVPEREIPLTPPGSESVRDFGRHCTACQLCVAACPNHVLRPSTDPSRFMQPEMGFEKGWCRPECARCSEVCPTGAIRKITREEKTEYHSGTARVNLDMCISFSEDVHCGNCAYHCPTGAIKMVKDDNGRRFPTVEASVCIGCGACENLCPVRPVSAITVNGRYNHREE